MSMRRRLICYLGLGFRVVDQGHCRVLTRRRNLEHWLEWRLWLDRDDHVLLRVDVDRVQHRQQQVTALLEVCAGPQLRQLRDQLPGLGSGVGLGQHQRLKLQITGPFLPVVLIVVVDAIDVGLTEPPKPLLDLLTPLSDALCLVPG